MGSAHVLGEITQKTSHDEALLPGILLPQGLGLAVANNAEFWLGQTGFETLTWVVSVDWGYGCQIPTMLTYGALASHLQLLQGLMEIG